MTKRPREQQPGPDWIAVGLYVVWAVVIIAGVVYVLVHLVSR